MKNNYLRIFLSLLIGVLLISTADTRAQSVGISGSAITPDSDALLEMRSTTKGFLVPRMTAAQIVAYTSAANSGGGLGAAEKGMTVFNTNTNMYNYWDGTQWRVLATATSALSSSLDDSYDAGGAGAGKTINADAGSVDIIGTGGLIVSGGKVGIGTTAPNSLFELNTAGGGSTGTFLLKSIRNSSVAGDQVGIGFGVQGGSHIVKSGIMHERLGSNGVGKLHFVVDNSNDVNDVSLSESRLTINPNGLVGIGNTGPSYNLDITGDTRTTGDFYGDVHVDDTRSDNFPPSTYDKEVAFDFKNRGAVGVGGSGTYSGMMTFAPWGDNSGNASHQLNFNQGGLFWRQGQPDNATWGAWDQIMTANSVNGFVNGDNLGNHTATTNLNMGNREVDNITFADMTPGNGNGLRFWSSNSYKISMGNSGDYRYGDVQDYSIKMNMNNDPQGDRGWTWGVDGLTPVASISTAGHMTLDGSLFLDCVTCGSSSDPYPTGGSGWGNMVIQGRVMSANSNIHLSPPAGSKVVINDTYRAAGGSTSGSAGLQVESLAGTGNRPVLANSSGDLYSATTLVGTGLGDNLGNHTATTALNMNNQNINSVGDIFSIQNYGKGLVGLYSSTRYQNVFAMGAAYRLAANGTTPSNLYGIAWTHSNIGGESISGLGHQALFMSNGDTRSAIGDGIWTKFNIYGNRFYDQNNTGYYLDPAQNDNNALTLAGGITVDGNVVIDNGAGWHRTYGQTGWYNGTYGSGMYATTSGEVATYNGSYLRITGVSNGSGNLRFDAANPYIKASSYFIAPGGAYFNSGTVYFEAATQHRGGIQNDGANYNGRVYIHDDIQVNGWARVNGTSGLYFETYGGGWHMTDGTWIRAYNNKPVYVQNLLRADGGIYATDFARMRNSSANQFGSINNFGLTGVTIEQHNSESGGFHADGDQADIWSPGDGGRILRIWDEDGMNERAYFDGGGRGYSSQGWSTFSDRSLKENIKPIKGALNKVLRIKGVTYDLKEEIVFRGEIEAKKEYDAESIKNQSGFIAQEILKVYPEVVTYDKVNNLYAVSYGAVVPLIVEAIKEQQTTIDDLNKEVEELKLLVEKLLNK